MRDFHNLDGRIKVFCEWECKCIHDLCAFVCTLQYMHAMLHNVGLCVNVCTVYVCLYLVSDYVHTVYVVVYIVSMSLPFLGQYEGVCWELLCYADKAWAQRIVSHVASVSDFLHRVQPAGLVALVRKMKSLKVKLKLRLTLHVLQLNIFNLIQVFKIRVNSWT